VLTTTSHRPILTPKTVLPLFFAVGIIFAPIGGLLLWASSEVQEISIDYSGCSSDSAASQAPNWGDIPSSRVSKYFKNAGQLGGASKAPQWQYNVASVTYPNGVTVPNTTVCSLAFDIEDDLHPPVLLYYRLTNFYQNHRRYVKSEDQLQLKGENRTSSQVKSGGCDPLTLDSDGKPYYPCGLIANSLFNDTFQQPVLQNPTANSTGYNMTTNGIAWSSDRDLYKPTSYTVDEVVPPPNWRRMYPAYNSSIPLPNLQEWEAFQVWMRTAGLPDFSKLAMRNDTGTMYAGRYQIDIWDEFDVTVFGGTKSILISTRTVMGGKNPFLGIAYVVVGGICILLGAIFTATHIIKPRYISTTRIPPALLTQRQETGRPQLPVME
jgi:hypothetical protein